MDTRETYRGIVKRLLTEYAQLKPSYGEIEVELIFDDRQDHYELIYSGWHEARRIHGSVIHIDLKGDKVWIQHDGTESGVAEELVAAGVPRDRIVLGFRSPGIRQYTGYAVA